MNFRLKAASFFLCNHDLEGALELLDNAEDTRPDEVVVREKFEYEPIESIIDFIDDLSILLKEVYEQGLADAKK